MIPSLENNEQPTHFKGKNAIEHVAEAQARGIIDSTEIHGTETSGKVAAGTDAARDAALVLALLGQLFALMAWPQQSVFLILSIVGFALLLWKAGRSAWLGWSRLERLHRVLVQEKWEIDHNRQQERDELRVLYATKGFEGKLLEAVLDVLMADGDRLLKVMVQEELGLSLAAYDHPLMQSVGAAVGVFCATAIVLLGVALDGIWGSIAAALLVIGVSAGLAAYFASNRIVQAVVWNLGLAAVALASLHFLLRYFFQL